METSSTYAHGTGTPQANHPPQTPYPNAQVGLPQNVAFSHGQGGPRLEPTSDAGHVAQALHQAQGKGMVAGITVLLRLRFETWLEARMTGPVLRKLEVRKKVAEAQKQTEVAQNALTGTL